jgi:hypothetical protein
MFGSNSSCAIVLHVFLERRILIILMLILVLSFYLFRHVEFLCLVVLVWPKSILIFFILIIESLVGFLVHLFGMLKVCMILLVPNVTFIWLFLLMFAYAKMTKRLNSMAVSVNRWYYVDANYFRYAQCLFCRPCVLSFCSFLLFLFSFCVSIQLFSPSENQFSSFSLF